MQNWVIDLITVLTILTLVCIPILVIKYVIQFFRNKTQITRLIVIGLSCLAFGLCYSNYRIIAFIFSVPLNSIIDIFCFFATVFLNLITVSAAFRIILILSEQGGHPVKGGNLVRYFYVTLAVILAVVNFFTYNSSPVYDFGFFVYQLNPILQYIILGFYAPLLIFIWFLLLGILKEVKSKKIILEIIILCFVLGGITFERYYHMVFHKFFDFTTYLLLDAIFTVTIWLTALIVVLKESEFIENISSYLSIQSIILLQKKGGNIILTHDFLRAKIKNFSIQNEWILYGFIHATSTGLENLLDPLGKVGTIEFGGIKIVMGYGNYINGALLTFESTPVIQRKLNIFIKKFEEVFNLFLTEKPLEPSKFDQKTVENLIDHLFLK